MPAAAAWRDHSGITKKNAEISRAVANRRLLPAVKSMGTDDVLVAPGTSCRRQVAELGGMTALHPAILIERLMTRETLG